MNSKKISARVLAFLCAAALSAIEIEDALHQTAEQFSSSIKSGTTIAIIGISSATQDLSDFMLDELTLGFVQTKKLTIANRANLEAIKTEMNFQLSGEVSDESIQQIGAMVGANIVVHGSLKPLGRNFNLVVQALDVTTAAVVDMCRFSVEPNDTTRVLLSGTPSAATKSNKKNATAKADKSAEKRAKAEARAAERQEKTAEKQAKVAAKQTVKPSKEAEKTPPASVPTHTKTPVSIPSGSDDYHIIDLSNVPPRDVRDNFYVYNRGEFPIQVAVYYVGANGKWVYAGGTMVKKRANESISELSGRDERPPLYGVRIADATGGSMKFLVSWDTGNHDLRIYVQPSFF